MKWLSDYVTLDTTVKEFCAAMTMSGSKVEVATEEGSEIKNVVVGKLLSVVPHENSDHLVVCQVDVGQEQPIQIVTGAPNVKAGDIVPVALCGAELPNGVKIKKGKLRGVESNGMLCSLGELGLTVHDFPYAIADGIFLIQEDCQIGQDIHEAIGLNDTSVEFEITSNRPDCLSVTGLAREAAATYHVPLNLKKPTFQGIDGNIQDALQVEIQNKEKCPRYAAGIVKNVKIAPSPRWMRERLRASGVRPINNLVDITNYVMLEYGQPMHAFDLRYVKDGKIVVRNAAEGETITTLDGVTRTLSPEMLVIADAEKPIAVAGVMGGEYSGINDDTHAVFLEAARFAKENIRATSRAIGLRSDSSARYEKGVDFNSVELGRERALTLFDKLGAGRVTSLFSRGGEKEPELKVIETTVDRINELFGITVSTEDMVRILTSLEFGVKRDGNVLTVTVPKFREDVDNYTDLAEEVIRFYGYSALTEDFIKFVRPTVGGVSVSQKNVSDIKNLMTAYGALEAYNYSFINVKQYDKLRIAAGDPRRNVIRIINPLSEEFGVMRTQLVGSMLNSVYINTSRKNNEFRLFEIAKTYIPKSLPLTELPEEHDTLCVAFVGKHEDFYALKSVIANVLKNRAEYVVERSCEPFLHSGISIDLIANGKKFGYVGKVHPLVAENFGIPEDVFVAEVDLSGFIADPEKIVRFKPLPKFPIVDRDLAVTVKEEYTVGELIACIKESIGNLCDSVELFDVYRGEQVENGYKSVAFSIKLYSDEKTLVDAQIQECMNKAVEGLGKKFGAKLR